MLQLMLPIVTTKPKGTKQRFAAAQQKIGLVFFFFFAGKNSPERSYQTSNLCVSHIRGSSWYHCMALHMLIIEFSLLVGGGRIKKKYFSSTLGKKIQPWRMVIELIRTG